MRVTNLTWKDVEKYLKEKDILLVPMGAVEQHGPMSPIGTDIIAAEEIADRISKRTNILVAPTITLGYVDPDFIRFPGTLCINLETFCKLLEDYLISYSKQGFKKFVIVNAHETQKELIKGITQKVCIQENIQVIEFEYWNVLKDEFKNLIKSDLIHACEDEVSIVLYTKPSLVKRDETIDEMPVEAQLDYFLYPSPKNYATKSGVMGKPSLATKEKGKIILDLIVKKMIRIIRKEFGDKYAK